VLKCDVYGRTPVSRKDEDDFVAGMLHADGGGLVISMRSAPSAMSGGSKWHRPSRLEPTFGGRPTDGGILGEIREPESGPPSGLSAIFPAQRVSEGGFEPPPGASRTRPST
jgi:hypothetical protein